MPIIVGQADFCPWSNLCCKMLFSIVPGVSTPNVLRAEQLFPKEWWEPKKPNVSKIQYSVANCVKIGYALSQKRDNINAL